MKTSWILLLFLPLVYLSPIPDTDTKDEEIDHLLETDKQILEQLKLVQNVNDSLKEKIKLLEEKIKAFSAGAGVEPPRRPEPSPPEPKPSTNANLQAAAQFDWLDGDNGLVRWQFNCDFPGSIKQSIPNARGEDCGLFCFRHNECNNFTYNSGTCFLKFQKLSSDGNVVPTTVVDGRVCGYIPSKVNGRAL